MKCSKCGFENPEGMNFCGKCSAKLELICPSCNVTNPPEFTFCGKCAHDLRIPKESPPLDYTAPQSYTPKFLADKILTTRSSIEGERKVVTVLFADVANYTSLSEKLDPEEVHEIMDGCFRILMDEIHRYEGTINQFTGDGVMALFGAPLAHENHAQRACHAALAIQRDLAEYGQKVDKNTGHEFRMRIGLNSGPVVVGSIGNDLRMDYTAIGDTTNLAARMQNLAKPGAILVTKETERLAREFFTFNSLGKLTVKGKEEPQEAYELLSPTEIGTRFAASVMRGLTPFVGRVNSMSVLKEAFNAAKAGAGQMVGLVGEAGVGKSRLLFEFINCLAGEDFTYLEGKCIHYGETLPYYPFIEIVKKYCGIEDADREYLVRKKLKEAMCSLDQALEGVILYFEDLLSLKIEDKAFTKMEPEHRKWKTCDAIKTLFVRIAQDRPLILTVDDMHWIDKSSEEVLTHLVEGIPHSRILLLCVYRPEYRHRWGELSYFTRLGLQQLSPESSSRLVEAILREGKVADDLRDLVLRKAGGNPLFMEEFTRNLLEMGAVGRRDDTYVLACREAEIEVPGTLQAVIAARVDRLEETLKQVLQIASVIGRDFAFRVLRIIMDAGEELRRHLANLTGLEFIHEKALFPELEYVFKHGLTQEVAYGSLLAQRRKEFHRRAAEAMEKLYEDRLPEYLGPLAYHYYRAEVWEKAFHYLKAAGDRARAFYATREAIDYYDKALEVSGRIADRVTKEELMDLHQNRGRMWHCMMEFDKALPDFEKVAEIAGELGKKAREWRAFMDIAICYGGGGGLCDFDKITAYGNRALEIIRETGDAAGEVRWMIQYGTFTALMGDSEGLANLEKALDICRQFGDKRGIGLAVGFLALAHSMWGEYGRCIEEARESAQLAKEANNRFLLLSTYHWALLGQGGLGEYDEAFRSLEELSRLSPEIGARHFVAMVPNHYGWLYSELCNFDKALLHDSNGVREAQRLEDPECEMFSLLNCAGDCIGLGDYSKAREYLDLVREKREIKQYLMREDRYIMHVTTYESELARIQGAFDKAIASAEETLAKGEKTQAKKYIATGWKLKGEAMIGMGRLDEAAACLEKARELADLMAHPPLMWKTRFLLGRINREKGQLDEAKALFEGAIAVIEKMTSKVSDAEVRATFLASQPVQAVHAALEQCAVR